MINLGCAQVPTDRPHLADPEFDAHIARLLSFSIPLIGVEDLHQNKSDYIVFDTREEDEFRVSHIEGAQYLGYKNFDISRLENIPKDSNIVLYCSVGYRSEKVGEQLMAMGFTKVYNLYGSIFEWVNRGFEVVDNRGEPTRKIHTYNFDWSQWMGRSGMEKIW